MFSGEENTVMLIKIQCAAMLISIGFLSGLGGMKELFNMELSRCEVLEGIAEGKGSRLACGVVYVVSEGHSWVGAIVHEERSFTGGSIYGVIDNKLDVG